MTRFAGVTGIAVMMALMAPALADDSSLLIGTWKGKATGPEGGPPSGDIVVAFERDQAGAVRGKMVVTAPGGIQYSGELDRIKLEKMVFSAWLVFKFGEAPLEVDIRGPLKGKTISGTFSVSSQGQKIGDGEFSITREGGAAGAAKAPR